MSAPVDVPAVGWKVSDPRRWNYSNTYWTWHWRVEHSDGRVLLNKAGRTKRFRSPEAAEKARAALAKAATP